MKRSKILIPTLSTLALTPVIALTACNQRSVEQDILDAVFKPCSLEKTVISNFKTEFDKLSDNEKKAELIYDAFQELNSVWGTGQEAFNIRTLYLDKNEGAFKVNVNECSVTKNNDGYLASLRGYLCYVFGKQHILHYQTNNGEITYTFNADDYIMVTFDFINRPMNLLSNEDHYYVGIDPDFSGACLGFYKFKCENGKKEFITPIEFINTIGDEPTNSKNWVPSI